MAIPVGALLGRYQIKAEIGRGAMGVVYRARDPKINRTVAIKTVSLAGLERDAEHEYRERFVVEAQAAGRLSHPRIVTIFDAAEDAETRAPYLVMEHIEGKSLDQVLSGENGRMPPGTALRLAQELAEALHYAHAQGVIHRDIKPANILVTADGHAKITDFGVAKLNQTHMTLRGQILGSPAFMAPEQLSGEEVDARSDLFSLGVVLYFMLTGQKPFQGNSIATVCFKLVNHEPLAVATYDMSFPPELDLVVTRALAKDPARRYQSGEEMARDIQRLRESCGLVETTEVASDAISRLPGNSRSGTSTSNNRPAVDAMAVSGIRDANQALRSVTLTWVRVLASLLVIGAIAFLIFSQAYKSRPDGAAPSGKDVTANRLTFEHANWRDSSTPPPSPAPLPPSNAKVRLEIAHPFTQARASIWLDNQLIYAGALRAETRSHLLVFRKTQGHASRKIDLQSGKHQLKVRVQSPLEDYDQSKTLAVNLAPKSETILNVSCDKKRNLLRVTLQ